MAASRRKVILINRPFQIRVALYVCVWLLAVFFVYPLILDNLFEFIVSYVRQDPHGPPLVGVFEARTELIRLLIVSQLGFLFLTFIVSLLLAHRIAGPVYKLSLFLDRVREGDLSQRLVLRKSDHFRELESHFNGMTASLRSRMNSIASRIEHAAGQNPEAARAELKALATEIRNGLGRE